MTPPNDSPPKAFLDRYMQQFGHRFREIAVTLVWCWYRITGER